MEDVSNRSDCIIKNLLSEIKGVQEKEFIMGVWGRQKNLSLMIRVWHHLASLMMLDSNPRDWFFYLPLTPMIVYSYSVYSIVKTTARGAVDSLMHYYSRQEYIILSTVPTAVVLTLPPKHEIIVLLPN